MWVPAHVARRFWQDTLVTDRATCVVEYVHGMLVPTIYIRNGGRVYPAGVSARLFMGPDAADQREWEMGLISAALGTAASTAVNQPASDPALEKTCPVLHAFMTALVEDGKARTPSSLTIFTEEGVWKGVLNEKDSNLKLWRTADTLQKLLQAFDKALASGSADWRRGYATEGKGGRGKGKR